MKAAESSHSMKRAEEATSMVMFPSYAPKQQAKDKSGWQSNAQWMIHDSSNITASDPPHFHNRLEESDQTAKRFPLQLTLLFKYSNGTQREEVPLKRCSASVFVFNGEFQTSAARACDSERFGIFRLLSQDATKHFPSGPGDNEKTSLIFTHKLILSSL